MIWIEGGFIDYAIDPQAVRGWRLANRWAVPRTGRRHPGSWLRRPRNIGVRRAAVANPDLSRAADVPPNSWDDIEVAANRSRNWKRHRETQWRDNPKPPQYWDKVRARRMQRRNMKEYYKLDTPTTMRQVLISMYAD